MPPETQAKLLRVLQERALRARRRHAADRGRRARRRRDAPRPRARGRSAAASARTSTTGCSVVEIALPPLRERREDVPALARALPRAGRRAARPRGEARSAPSALAALARHALARQRARAAQRRRAGGGARDRATRSSADDLRARRRARERGAGRPARRQRGAPVRGGEAPRGRALRARFLLDALRANDGNISRTAEAIGMVRQSLQQKIRELGLRDEDWSRPMSAARRQRWMTRRPGLLRPLLRPRARRLRRLAARAARSRNPARRLRARDRRARARSTASSRRPSPASSTCATSSRREIDERRVELARTPRTCARAVARGDDELALALIDAQAAPRRRARARRARARRPARARPTRRRPTCCASARRSARLEREKGRTLATLANARARRRLQETLDGPLRRRRHARARGGARARRAARRPRAQLDRELGAATTSTAACARSATSRAARPRAPRARGAEAPRRRAHARRRPRAPRPAPRAGARARWAERPMKRTRAGRDREHPGSGAAPTDPSLRPRSRGGARPGGAGRRGRGGRARRGAAAAAPRARMRSSRRRMRASRGASTRSFSSARAGVRAVVVGEEHGVGLGLDGRRRGSSTSSVGLERLGHVEALREVETVRHLGSRRAAATSIGARRRHRDRRELAASIAAPRLSNDIAFASFSADSSPRTARGPSSRRTASCPGRRVSASAVGGASVFTCAEIGRAVDARTSSRSPRCGSRRRSRARGA